VTLTQPPDKPTPRPQQIAGQKPASDSARRPPTIPYAGSIAPLPIASDSAPPAPPAPPRPVTPAASRRCWTDPIIRFWLLATVALIGIGGWFLTEQVIASRNEAWLIANGTLVTAKAIAVNGESRTGAKYPPGTPVTLKFDWKDQAINVEGSLTSNDFITTGETVQLRVDPNDTASWTDRTVPESLAHRLIAGAVIIPAVLITIIAALILRRRLLNLWQNAEAALYTVVVTRHSALAPLSHTVNCVLGTGRDPTIIVVYVPARFPRPQPGEVLWLIRPPGKSKTAIAACAFE
jgi:hypothetical protein